MTADESEFAIGRPVRTEFQIIVDLCRLAVFVGAKDADIEIESRIFEVVRIPAIKRDLLFGRKDEAHVIVTLVPVKMVSATLVKPYDGRKQSGIIYGLFI